jgi:ABC-type nickel/cobalt efflux system permease component RcnA
VGAYRYVSAVSAEILDGMLPEKRLPPRALCRNVLIRTPESAGRSHDGRGTYSLMSLVSAVMLAGIGPVKLFWIKLLITHSEGCGRAERSTHALAQRGRPAWAARNPKAHTQPCTCAARHAPPRR